MKRVERDHQHVVADRDNCIDSVRVSSAAQTALLPCVWRASRPVRGDVRELDAGAEDAAVACG